MLGRGVILGLSDKDVIFLLKSYFNVFQSQRTAVRDQHLGASNRSLGSKRHPDSLPALVHRGWSRVVLHNILLFSKIANFNFRVFGLHPRGFSCNGANFLSLC